jgi:hypothetical protein
MCHLLSRVGYQERVLIRMGSDKRILQPYLFEVGPTPILMKDLPGFNKTELGRHLFLFLNVVY